MSTQYHFDVLIIGTGSAGLMSALQLSDDLSIALIAKDKILEGSSYYAQGGISAVLDNQDYFESHIADTLSTGVDLGNEAAVRFMVEQAPSAIESLEQAGVIVIGVLPMLQIKLGNLFKLIYSIVSKRKKISPCLKILLPLIYSCKINVVMAPTF